MESKYCVTCNADVVKVELVGRLDATNAEGLQADLKALCFFSVFPNSDSRLSSAFPRSAPR